MDKELWFGVNWYFLCSLAFELYTILHFAVLTLKKFLFLFNLGTLGIYFSQYI